MFYVYEMTQTVHLFQNHILYVRLLPNISKMLFIMQLNYSLMVTIIKQDGKKEKKEKVEDKGDGAKPEEDDGEFFLLFCLSWLKIHKKVSQFRHLKN